MAWAKKIYVATTNKGVYYTENFVSPGIQPIWRAINNGLDSLICTEFHLDPFHQEERQYVLTGGYDTPPTHNGLYRRFMEQDWIEILSSDEFATTCVPSFVSARIRGFCTDPIIDGRLWAVGNIYVEENHYYGPFGWGPYFENRAVFSDNWGETWQAIPSWWTGVNLAIPSSIRSYGDTLYEREGGGTGDYPYIEYSYDKGNTMQWTITDILQWTLGGFLNPLTPARFYYDIKPEASEFVYFESGTKYHTLDGVWLGDSRWDTIWYDPDDSLHMRLINQKKIFTTYDGWQSATSSATINTLYTPTLISPYAGDNIDYMILGMVRLVEDVPSPAIGTLSGETDTNLAYIAGGNWATPPYTDSIPVDSNPCRCGIQGVRRLKGYVYVNGIAMPEYTGNTDGGIPMEGDRTAWNARYYAKKHTNDTDISPSTIHHTLAPYYITPTTASYKAAPGDHSHYLKYMDSGSATYGEFLTSLGTGSSTWSPLPNHSHAGSAIGDGNRFDADHLSSGSQPFNMSLTYESGSLVWKAINDWRLSIIEDTILNSSDKTLVVPANEELQILWIWVEYTSSSSSGLRQLEIQIKDSSDNTINQWQTGIAQNENSSYKYLFGMVIPDLTSLRDNNYLMTPIPSTTILSAGQKIHIWDNKAIDSSNDDMIVRLQYSYHAV